jgi:hypothetical protein
MINEVVWRMQFWKLSRFFKEISEIEANLTASPGKMPYSH